MHSYITKSPLY